MTTTTRTYTCPRCNEERNRDDATEAPCRACGVCATCVPTWRAPGLATSTATCRSCRTRPWKLTNAQARLLTGRYPDSRLSSDGDRAWVDYHPQANSVARALWRKGLVTSSGTRVPSGKHRIVLTMAGLCAFRDLLSPSETANARAANAVDALLDVSAGE